MNKKRSIDWQYFIGLMTLPVVIAALLWVAARIQEMTRYNPRYFTAEYQQRYQTPASLIPDLEDAIQQGDGLLMAELQGSRAVPRGLQPQPDIRFSIFWDEENGYLNYLFFDFSTYGRHMKHFTPINGRYVVVPENLAYYINSGRWLDLLVPLAIFYWLVLTLFTLGIWVYRSMAAVREEMYG